MPPTDEGESPPTHPGISPAASQPHPRTVVITGSASGIGEGVARACAARHDNVVLVDLNAESLATLAEELSGSATAVLIKTTDVTDTAAVEELVSEVLSTFGRLDVLIAAAGGHTGAKLTEEVTDEEWDRSLALNLTSAFKCARAVVGPMKEQRSGRIVLISSATARMATTVASSVVHYAVAKAGIMGMVRELAVELGAYGVTANAVAPGTTYTRRVEAFRSVESLSGIAATIPLGRVANVADQVGPIMFLASDDARYVTGAVLDVNGGRVMS